MRIVRTFTQETPISGRFVEVHWTDTNGARRRVHGMFDEVNGRFTVGGVDVEYASTQGGTWFYLN